MAPFLPKLQGYFAEFLSRGSLERLGMLYRTTCVGLRYGLPEDMLRSFSRKSGYARRRRRSAPLLSGSPSPADLPAENIATPFSVLLRQARRAFTLSSLLRSPGRSRNINRIPFGAPFRVVLRSRLTPVRLTLTGKPWSCGVGVSRTHYRYLCLHLLFRALQRSSRATFSAARNAPLPLLAEGTASAVCFTPAYYPRPAARLVSCYALFR